MADFFKKMPSRLESDSCVVLRLSPNSFPVSFRIYIEVSLPVCHDPQVWWASHLHHVGKGGTDVPQKGPRCGLSDPAAHTPCHIINFKAHMR